MLWGELEAIGCIVTKKEKIMYVLGALNETFDNVFSTLTENMLINKTMVYDAKGLLLSYQSKIERRRATIISPLPSVNIATRNDFMTKGSFMNNDTISNCNNWLLQITINKV